MGYGEKDLALVSFQSVSKGFTKENKSLSQLNILIIPMGN